MIHVVVDLNWGHQDEFLVGLIYITDGYICKYLWTCVGITG